MDDREVRYGQPSVEEWSGLWLARPDLDQPTYDQYRRFLQALERHLDGAYRLGLKDDSQLYARGDWFGDRTEHLVVIDATILDQLIPRVQGLLQSTWREWRVILDVVEGDRAIAVYPDVVRD